METQKEIIPYVQTCTFTWSPEGKLTVFKYNKIDFKQLNPKDKRITYNSLDSWVKFCKSSEPKTKFISNDTKLIDDENDCPNKIITKPFKRLAQWNYSNDSNINFYLNYINCDKSLPKLFTFYESNDSNSNTNQFIGKHKNSLPTIPNSRSSNENSETSSMKNRSLNNININTMNDLRGKFLLYNVKNNEYQMRIIKRIKIKPLSSEAFYKSISSLLESIDDEETTVLVDTLNIINYNINHLIEQKSEFLISFQKKSLLTLFKTLEIKKKYEYLFLCVTVIASRIFYDCINVYNKGNSTNVNMINEFKERKNIRSGSSCIYFHRLFSNSFLGMSSKSLNSVKSGSKRELLGSKESLISKESQQEYTLIDDQYGNIKDLVEYDENDYEGVSVDEQSEDENKNNKKMRNSELNYSLNSANINNKPKKDSKIEEYFLSLTQEYNECNANKPTHLNNLVKIFGKGIIDIIIKYLYFFANELHQMRRNEESDELKKFALLISKKTAEILEN